MNDQPRATCLSLNQNRTMAIADGVTEEYATAINEAIETANRAEVTTDRLWTELNDLTDKYNDLVTACIEKNERLQGLFAWLKSICTVHGLHACGKVGHMERDCHAKAPDTSGGDNGGTPSGSRGGGRDGGRGSRRGRGRGGGGRGRGRAPAEAGYTPGSASDPPAGRQARADTVAADRADHPTTQA
jgi:hypothetical protein